MKFPLNKSLLNKLFAVAIICCLSTGNDTLAVNDNQSPNKGNTKITDQQQDPSLRTEIIEFLKSIKTIYGLFHQETYVDVNNQKLTQDGKFKIDKEKGTFAIDTKDDSGNELVIEGNKQNMKAYDKKTQQLTHLPSASSSPVLQFLGTNIDHDKQKYDITQEMNGNIKCCIDVVYDGEQFAYCAILERENNKENTIRIKSIESRPSNDKNNIRVFIKFGKIEINRNIAMPKVVMDDVESIKDPRLFENE